MRLLRLLRLRSLGLSILAVTTLVAGAPAPASAATVMCDGQQATIVGTSGRDDLFGTDGPDVIAGLAGDDSIHAMEGNDVVCGGKGSDDIDGSVGNDRLLAGEPGDDRDSLFGTQGDDVLIGVPGGRTQAFYHSASSGVRVDLAAGTATGGDGNDTLISISVVYGSQYDDTLVGSAESDFLNGGFDGDDRIFGGGGDDQLNGECGSDVLRGQDGNDSVRGTWQFCEDEVDLLDGGTGDDVLYPSHIADDVSGGRGWDFVAYFEFDVPIRANLGKGFVRIDGQRQDIPSIENISGGSADDVLIGTDAINHLSGGKGNDTLRGLGGDDDLQSGDDDDRIEAGTGDDRVYGGSGDDVMIGNDGDDNLDGQGGDDHADGRRHGPEGDFCRAETTVRCDP